MLDHQPLHIHVDHFDQCSCKLLARAFGLNPHTVSFEYCHRVLHHHWQMNCKHVQHKEEVVVAAIVES